jgi:type IV secretory pathway VirB9-like protein
MNIIKFCSFLIFLNFPNYMHVAYADILPDIIEGNKLSKDDELLRKIENNKVNLDAIHKAMIDSKPEDSVINIDYKSNQVVKIFTRIDSITVIELPKGEVVSDISFGNGKYFMMEKLSKTNPSSGNFIAIKTMVSGVDTSLHILTRSNRLYTFHLFALDTKSQEVFYSTVRVNDFDNKYKFSDIKERDAKLGLSNARYDFLDEACDDGPLDANYSFFGDEEIAPWAVYDRGGWTYFDFRKGLSLGKLPIIQMIIDGISIVVKGEVRNGFVIIKKINRGEGWKLSAGNKKLYIKYGW